MINGLLGKKVGMTQLFGAEARVVPVTVLEVGPCVVTQVRTQQRDGYDAVQIGFGRAKQLSMPARGHLRLAGAESRHLREFGAIDPSEHQVGNSLAITQFQAGDLVDVVSTTKGRGFQGVMKRHGFSGGQKTHGQGDRDRAPGSIGAGTYPGRVYKGKKMPGHMGNRRVTARNLLVERVDVRRRLLMVRGAVPGSRDTLVAVRYAKGTQLAERLSDEEWAAILSEQDLQAGAVVAVADVEEEAAEEEAAEEEAAEEEATEEEAAEEGAAEEEAPAEDEGNR